MNLLDKLLFCWRSVSRTRLRSMMLLLAMAIGVCSVVMLTSLGEGARNYVMQEFAFLGKDVLVMFPGRNETTGGLPPVTGAAARNITLTETLRLQRAVPAILKVAPVIIGSTLVSHGERGREVIVLGTTGAFPDIRQMSLDQGRNLHLDPGHKDNECLVGSTLLQELLPNQPAIGQLLRVADYRCRVVGVLSGRGDAFGMDLSDSVLVSISLAQQLFNTDSLFRVLLQVNTQQPLAATKKRIEEEMARLHQNELDVTIVSPDAMLATFDQILTIMTLAVGGIGAISLLVAGVLVMNLTIINTSQRTPEIGLLKALGAAEQTVLQLILWEAALLALAGALTGLLASALLLTLASVLWPSFPMQPPLWAVVAATATAVLAALLFAWVPARRASRLSPIHALYRR
ncbi:ABC transporter permease [Pseudomaricurvus sp. HS19]|uniref:ABC transporter permease n=1 Tax=Pseudomaricurvus sp. HS19 TaxID=2692626 RepID=UPI001367C301|nr:ABC transporter permease [Pseudomaricurvus sp. HS19]MYM62095.1 FtsX-like permease family protein [Pseudomaricurvus sp. HS19]